MKLKPCLLLLPTLLLAACGGGGHGHDNDTPTANIAVVAARAGDYSSGAVSLVERTAPFTAHNNLNATVSDIAVRADGDHFFMLRKFGSNQISRYETATPTTATYTYSTNDDDGLDSNPYDIVVASPSKAYLLRYGSGKLWIVDPSASDEADFKTGEIDLSAYDADGVPEMSAGLIRDGKLYVALQRLQNFAATQNGHVVVIDIASDAVEQDIELPVRDPVRLLALPDSDDLLVVADGGYDGAFGTQYDGGIVRLDPIAGSATLQIDDGDAETHLYGTFVDAVIADGHRAYLIGSNGFGDTANSLYRFDPASDAAPLAVDGFTDGDFGSLAVDPDGQLWIARTSAAAPGLTVLGFDGDSETVDSALIDTVLAPINVDFGYAPGE